MVYVVESLHFQYRQVHALKFGVVRNLNDSTAILLFDWDFTSEISSCFGRRTAHYQYLDANVLFVLPVSGAHR